MIIQGNTSSQLKKWTSRQALKDIGNIQINNRKKKTSRPGSAKSSSRKKNNSVSFAYFQN